AAGAVRVFALLHGARAVLLNLGRPWACDTSPWSARVQTIDAEHDGDWELPVLGRVAAPTAVLIRPDGYAAWVGDGTDTGLRGAWRAWFGARGRPGRGRARRSPRPQMPMRPLISTDAAVGGAWPDLGPRHFLLGVVSYVAASVASIPPGPAA